MDNVIIRVATMAELPLLLEIERASGEIFRDIGMPEIADDAPMPVETLAHHHVWVAEEHEPVAFAVATVIDRCAHIEQVSVHPTHARLGIGRRLLDHIAGWATAQGLQGLTLTTFREVPWNGPYYERIGFRVLTELTPGLEAVIAAETARGLKPDTRVCMRRDLGKEPDMVG
jgi:GNAT superfamily N-acetyltransferase